MKIIGIILARIGSQRIKKKNIKLLGNKPLVDWTINFCEKLDTIEKVILSTDSKRIKSRVNGKKKVIAPWLRPKKLSGSKITSGIACLHALKWYEKNYNKVDGVILFQPTSPFRSKKKILNGINLFKKTKNSVISVSPVKKSLNLNFGDYIIHNNKLKYATTDPKSKKIYRTNGSFYITTTKFLKKNYDFKREGSYPLLVNKKHLSIDIDTNKDLALANNYLKKRYVFKS